VPRLAPSACFAPWHGNHRQLPAITGNRTILDIIGYSQGLRYFAYEEYGEFDGIGLAYSSV
jgi:predicted secreted protein